ncbi:hypothetical protein AAMO2058_000248600, partial [Amorphochlora amoebiformis]
MYHYTNSQYNNETGDQNNLVYRVHPLPESMIDHVYDFVPLHSRDAATTKNGI